MAGVKTLENGNLRISLPPRWVALFAVPLLGVMGLTFQSTRTQADVVERALLVHAQEKHRMSASAADLQRVEFVQDRMGEDVAELRGLMKDLMDEMQELIAELRARNVGVRP